MVVDSIFSAVSVTGLSIYAGIAVFVSLYIPGTVLFPRKNHVIEQWLAGLVVWAWAAVIIGYANMRWVTYAYLALCFGIWILRRRKGRLKPVKRKHTMNRYAVAVLAVFIVGAFGQVNRFLPSGFEFPKGIYMFTASSDDAFWHGALTNQLVSHFPPMEPGLRTQTVTNYHYWSNLVIAEYSRVFGIPVMFAQFVVAPIGISVLLGLVALRLMTLLDVSEKGRLFGVWLLYFASDVNYLVSYATKRQLAFDVHPLEDGTMLWENPPRAFSYVVTLAGLIFLIRWLRKNDTKAGVYAALAFGALIGFKVHTGIVALGGLAFVGAYFLWKREIHRIWMPLLSAILAVIVYVPVNGKSGLPIVAPFEMARMYAAQVKLGLSFLELRREIYAAHFNLLRQWQMDLTMLAVFFLGQFGIRNIGWAGIRNVFSRQHVLGMWVSGGIIAGCVLGTVFIQPVAGADIFNAYLAVSLVLWIASVCVFDAWSRHMPRPALWVFAAVVLCITLPRWVYKTYMPPLSIFRAKPVISARELEAMNYVRNHTDPNDTVAVFNANTWDSVYPYVSIFTNRPMYLSGQVILGRHGINFQHEDRVMKTLMETKDPQVFSRLLRGQHIRLLYYYGDQKPAVSVESLPIKSIFSNGEIQLYSVDTL